MVLRLKSNAKYVVGSIADVTFTDKSSGWDIQLNFKITKVINEADSPTNLREFEAELVEVIERIS